MSQNEDCTPRRSVKERRSTSRCLKDVCTERRSFRPRRRLAEAVAPSFADKDADEIELGTYLGVRTPARPSQAFNAVWTCAGLPDRIVVDNSPKSAADEFLRSAHALGITVEYRPGFPSREA